MLDRVLPVAIHDLPAGTRFSLRTAEPASCAGTLPLPRRIGEVGEAEGYTVFCLGPDEWMLIGAGEAAAPAAPGCAVIDISDREVAFALSGSGVMDAVAAGCPRDLRRFAPGTAVRTLYAGVDVIVWRQAADRFEIHVWRSFAPFVRHRLETVARELALGL
ncbi:sarcosine oxidase subunit gamma [Acuticoccus sp. MNP-M23]|uniref:sarcosine oxidase subunit gamma n=1 Tax=Acuticoccus sp. MNP-M23 TaxID=3072793 RepID=UPI0028156D46|nr:sarcosine oxidase subunit gamma [Acuticoccus sp. MNP-M23]WMS44756.1 sarcosine oxidase subunit gamma [Acuticoccus sp. MNP-M23]